MNSRLLLPQRLRQKIKLSQRRSRPPYLIEAIGDNSADMVYVPGFGWIESQGPNQATCAEDMYENGNKIGIMG